MERRPLLRASDADRERVAEQLRVAATEGRLTSEELEDRLRSTYLSRTYGQLDELVADLPVASAPPAVRGRNRMPVWTKPALVVAALLAVLTSLFHEHAPPVVHHGAQAAARGATGGHVFDPGFPVHHLFALAADAAAGVLLVLVLTGLAVWALVRRLGRLV